MLYANLLLNVLYHIEIEMKIRESCLQTGNFIYKPGISLTKQDFHLQRGSLGLQRGFSGYYLPSHQTPTLYDVVPKEEIAEFEELMRKTIADIVSEASSVACWVYVQKYVKQKTLDEMLQELPGAGQFIIVMDTWFERLMVDQ